MMTQQNEIRRILTKLNGIAPDDAMVAKLANIAEATEVKPGDALFPTMIALDHYRILFEKVPESIKEASAFILREHSAALRAEAEKITLEQKRKLEDVTSQLASLSLEWLQKSMPAVLEKTATLAVGEPVKAAIDRIEKASKAANTASDEATLKLRHATATLQGMHNTSAKTLIAWLCTAALFGGGIAGGFLLWAVDRAPAPLTADQQSAIQLGTALQSSWAKLPPQVQKAIGAAGVNIKKSGE